MIDHYENPRNVGKMDPKKKNVGTGLVGAPACGDVMKLQIEVDDDGKIIDAKFKVRQMFTHWSCSRQNTAATWFENFSKSRWNFGIFLLRQIVTMYHFGLYVKIVK